MNPLLYAILKFWTHSELLISFFGWTPTIEYVFTQPLHTRRMQHKVDF